MAHDVSEKNTVQGTVEESLPNTEFRVTLDSGEETIAFLSGKMRLHRIKVLVGDRVAMVVDPYGGKSRIMRRL